VRLAINFPALPAPRFTPLALVVQKSGAIGRFPTRQSHSHSTVKSTAVDPNRPFALEFCIRQAPDRASGGVAHPLTCAGSNSSIRRAPPNQNPSAPRRVAPMNRPPEAIATVGQLDRPQRRFQPSEPRSGSERPERRSTAGRPQRPVFPNRRAKAFLLGRRGKEFSPERVNDRQKVTKRAFAPEFCVG